MSDSDDDWETDPDYVNDVSEKEQRWGSKEIVKDTTELHQKGLSSLAEEVKKSAAESTQRSGFARGYGGEFGHEEKSDQTTNQVEGQKKYTGKEEVFIRK
eukprot:CAMPEP_0113869372 /NCGR_PEP_ID=MMETSP0780_2-20120614/1500_1 /TAXON_ID=652834 /ORGANISM="Palpitomonas bilix" /LENGTH=99 /DNA_ID=CAMNT_0000854543 /DNA_START=36 /DNA_END=335 /DNA_ORIENTATION=- /assembly_acc=CAM_ASM_000599